MGHEAINDVTSGNYKTAIGYQQELVTPPQVIIMSL